MQATATNAALYDEGDFTGFLKAGILGFPGSGKTFTAAMIAVAVRRHFKLEGPISMFDTENGGVYLQPVVKALTGKPLLVKRARSFDDLMKWGHACREANVAVGFADSITHPWRELCDAYLQRKQDIYKAKNWNPPDRLEFQDWNILKPRWGQWTELYLNSPLHLIICGRAGFEYDFQENERGKKELVKTGVKMKTESEFGFEPSLMIEMERDQDLKGEAPRIVRRAVVLKDRFNVIDGVAREFGSEKDAEKALAAVYDFIRPHLDMLCPGSHTTIDAETKSDFKLSEEHEDAWQQERRSRQILSEEIQGELVAAYPGQTAAEKKMKTDLIVEFFNTRSWTKVESTDSGRLRKGLGLLRERLSSKNGENNGEPVTHAEFKHWLEALDATGAEKGWFKKGDLVEDVEAFAKTNGFPAAWEPPHVKLAVDQARKSAAVSVNQSQKTGAA